MARKNTSAIDRATYEIRYDTSVEAGDLRALLKTASSLIRNGVTNETTERAIAEAKLWLEEA